MKKILKFITLVMILSAMILFAFSACDTSDSSDSESESVSTITPTTTYTVTLKCNNGASDSYLTVKKGETLKTPTDPKKENYIFTGWYTNSSLTIKYDFSQPVNKSFNLYAGFELDAVTLTNAINTTYIKGVVTVYNKCYNTFLGITTSGETHQGSGFCFKISGSKYYILTNCHVAYFYSSYSKQSLTIEDYQGNEYTGYLCKNTSKTIDSIAASYDLACLYFTSTSTDVEELEFGSNPSAGDDVISLGTPQGQTNYINYGTVSSYKQITVNTSDMYSNVTFNVICHSATINGGCSGGPILNSKLEVVGVNYAGSSTDTSYNFAIPVEKVQEFLDKYLYS